MNDLAEGEIVALREALDDEYRSWAIYDQVTHDFGDSPPFSHIRDAEARHVEALRVLFSRHGLPVPHNPWLGKVPRFANVSEACEAAVAAEIANAALYQRLFASTQRPDILAVFRNLQAASQQRHLVAFQRCTQRDGGGRHRGSGGTVP